MPVTLDDDATRRLTAEGQPFEVASEEIRGIPTRVWKHAPASLRPVFEGARAHGDADFLVYEDDRWSFERHHRAVASVARWLVDEAGVRKGDRVAIAMRNYPEWSVAFWAAVVTGAIVVPLNAWWLGEELAYGLSDSGTSVLFADTERVERLAGQDLGSITTVVARGEGPVRFEGLIGEDDPDLPDVEIGPEDDATIFYTSGTTGKPKGALGTHRNIVTNLMSLGFSGARSAAIAGAQPTGVQNRACSLLSVPFFHATGCHSTLVPVLAAGAKLVLMHRWDPERALELIEREGVTRFGGVPAMVWQVLESPDFAKRDTSSVQGVGYGGAPCPPELVRRINEHFPRGGAGQGYGLTETSSVTTTNGGQEYAKRPDSVGRPMPVCDVKVVDEVGTELGTDEVGELWIKGPNVVKGYWNKPEATAEAITDGWLHTGDVARIDAEGFVYIVDRAKDMVIRGGENVYSVEIEDVLYEHAAVSEAAVIGVPHEVLGEEVAAVVKRVAGAEVTEDDLKDHVGQRLAAFKVPVRIWVRDEPLPRNPAGKVLKRDLKQELLEA